MSLKMACALLVLGGSLEGTHAAFQMKKHPFHPGPLWGRLRVFQAEPTVSTSWGTTWLGDQATAPSTSASHACQPPHVISSS